MLRLVLPKGSLEESTLELFADADLKVNRSSAIAYQASIRDDRIADVTILRPQEIPLYVAQGIYDLGITGRDWVEERSADVVSLGELPYSKTPGVDSIRIVLAVADASPCKSIEDLTGGDRPLRVATEYPELARRALSAADPDKRRAMDQIATLLMGTLEAREKVLVKLNVSAERRAAVIARLPSLRSPTVSELAGDGGFAIETVVRKDEINTLIPELKELGASDILELALAKIVH